jgi:pantoate--beta-alanine ligase
MQDFSRRNKAAGKSIGFVPTMGALHEGHLSLIRRARRENDIAVVSIFVNPTQFAPQEDLKKYPRDLKRDARLCSREGVDCIFYPAAGQMYPAGYRTYVTVEKLSDVLCGKSRPGHFKGVATVVTKLFNIVNPDSAYFGQKDAQQAIIIKRMASDLNMPVEIKVMPTLRAKDGLALSSRNVYLSKQERKDALVLSGALKAALNLVKAGAREPAKVIKKMQQLILAKKTAKIDYISLVDLDRLEPVKRISAGCLLALAVRIGKTRLIDNAVTK